MKRFIVLLLACALAFAFACSKENEKADASRKQAESTKVFLVDPVSREPIKSETTKWTYVYNGVEYRFNSENNMKEFKADPEKYLEQVNQ